MVEDSSGQSSDEYKKPVIYLEKHWNTDSSQGDLKGLANSANNK
jgi:hypothetical protein